MHILPQCDKKNVSETPGFAMISLIMFLTKITIFAVTFSGKTNNIQLMPNGQCNLINLETITLVIRLNANEHMSTKAT